MLKMYSGCFLKHFSILKSSAFWKRNDFKIIAKCTETSWWFNPEGKGDRRERYWNGARFKQACFGLIVFPIPQLQSSTAKWKQAPIIDKKRMFRSTEIKECDFLCYETIFETREEKTHKSSYLCCLPYHILPLIKLLNFPIS